MFNNIETVVMFMTMLGLIVYTILSSRERERKLIDIVECYGTQLERIANELVRLAERQDRMEQALMAGRGISVSGGSAISVGKDMVGGDAQSTALTQSR